MESSCLTATEAFPIEWPVMPGDRKQKLPLCRTEGFMTAFQNRRFLNLTSVVLILNATDSAVLFDPYGRRSSAYLGVSANR